MSAINWTPENVDKLMSCQTQEDFELHFPGRNIETLKRRQREFKNTGVQQLVEDIPDAEQGSLQLSGDSGVIKTGAVAEPITDWTETLQLWGLDPEVFEVIQPVTMKAWGTPGNFRYSYAARIQKKADQEPDVISKLDLEGWRNTLKDFVKSPARTLYVGNLSYLILVADPQLGKPGTSDALRHWSAGVEGHIERARNLIDAGMPINEFALAFMGDEHEGCVGNYASQPYEVEMDYSSQIELDFDMRVWTIRQMLEVGLPIKIASVPSNHGEHTRFGTHHAVTSIYDNSSTMVASLAKKVFDGTEAEEMLEWYIPKDRQDANLNLSGVDCNFTHGHVSKGSGTITGGQRSKSALERQILGRREELTNTDLFFSAHYHHFNVIEDRGRTFFGCPALEAVQKSGGWFYDSNGVWSRPGMLGMVVGNAVGERKWTELDVI